MQRCALNCRKLCTLFRTCRLHMLYSSGRCHAEIVRYLVVMVVIVILNPIKQHKRCRERFIQRLAGIIKRSGLDLAVVYMDGYSI